MKRDSMVPADWPGSRRRPLAALAVVLAALWGMFFLSAGVLLALALFLCIAGFYFRVMNTARLDRIGLLVLANYAVWIGSGLLVGSLSVTDLLTPGYYPQEGRIFLYYLPLLFFSVAVATEATLHSTVRIICWITGAVTVLLALWLLTGLPMVARHATFIGFLTSHTGAGIYFGCLAVFLLIYGVETRRRLPIALGLLAVLAVFGAASREALVGLAGVAAWYQLQRGRWRSLAALAVGGVVLVGVMYVLTPHTFDRTFGILNANTFRAIARTIETSRWQPGTTRTIDTEDADPNVLVRIMYWVYTVKLIGLSPIIGVGFGRWNDAQIQFVGIPHLGLLAVEGKKNLLLAQAHNSYLELLAETGLLGLALALSIWVALYRRMGRAIAEVASRPSLAAYFVACQGLIVYTLIDANFGHALASPSLGVPVLCIIGVGLAGYRHMRRFPPEPPVHTTS